MKHEMRFAIIVSLTVLMSVSALTQTSVPPPPRPADNGPSLAVTMQYIQDKLNDIGKVNFVMFYQNTIDNSNLTDIKTNEVSNVVADPNQCRVTYHWKVTRGDAIMMNGDFWFSFRDVQDIVIKTYVQYQTELNASLGNPNFITTSTNPPLIAMVVRRPHGVTNLFPFTDADTADRVAKAFTHAVELCGGGNKDPF